jgi:hypothetical protein
MGVCDYSLDGDDEKDKGGEHEIWQPPILILIDEEPEYVKAKRRCNYMS